MKGIASLRAAVDDYVALRRALGFKLSEAPLLQDFARHLKAARASHVTTRLALDWAKRSPRGRPAHWARRLTLVRQFARHMTAIDPRTEVPPAGLLPFHPQRCEPYLYTDNEIRRLLVAARRLPSKVGLRGATYSTLLGLLVVTGLRISEAIGLDDPDVDFDQGVLAVRESKCRKSRQVPVDASTVAALRRYEEARNRVLPCRFTRAFFVDEAGHRLRRNTVDKSFRRLCRRAGVGGQAGRRPPRLHDFRHRLAVQTLVRWYREGKDVERQLPILSTYLGHAHIADTYWYLTAVPELLRLAADRLEDHGRAS